MKNSKLITIGIMILFLVSLNCGGKKMSDEDFDKINQEVILESMKKGFEESFNNPEKYDEKYYEILKEICEKYGYSVSDFEKKAKEKIKDFKAK
ncbi:MAG: hypothetical protein N2490_02505 [Ignavibacteria bacterium]|nr:hypothetical protein [Ignavibacteria bacterium]